MTIQYEKYEKLIQKLSWNYSRTSTFNQEDLFCEGNLIFAKCCQDYVPEKSKFSTYLFICINGHFKNMIRLQDKIDKNTAMSVETCGSKGDKEVYILETKKYESPEQTVQKYDAYAKLSCEAKEVIHILLNGPAEVIDTITSPITKVFQKRKVLKFMKDKLGWEDAVKAERELTEFVKLFRG